MIFVDTSVWFAAYVAEEPASAEAASLLARPASRLVTTDFVIDELLTLLIVRNRRDVATNVGEILLEGDLCRIVWTRREDVLNAWQVFRTYSDKQWSFTDCLSYVVMRRLGIREALSLDDHFRQFAFVSVLP